MIPFIHYLFYCQFKLKTIYIGILTVLSIASIIGTSSAACAKPRCRPFKAILFIALGLYGRWNDASIALRRRSSFSVEGVAPATHACIIHGFPRMFHMGFLYLVTMAVTYIAGGVAYAVRVPERFFPGRERMSRENLHALDMLHLGRFDIVGQSHQILHVAVIAAIYLHFYGISCAFHTAILTEQCLLPISLKLGVTDLSISSSSVES